MNKRLEDILLMARRRKNKRNQRRPRELRMTLDQKHYRARQTYKTKIWMIWKIILSKHRFRKVIKKTTS